MNKRSGKEGQLDQLKESRHLFRQPLRKQFKHWREQMILGEMPMVVGGTWCIEQWKFGRTIIRCIFCTVKRSSYLPVNHLYHGGTDSWWRERDGNELVPLPLLLWTLFSPPWCKKYRHEVTLCNRQRPRSSLKSSWIWYNRTWGISWLHPCKHLCIVVAEQGKETCSWSLVKHSASSRMTLMNMSSGLGIVYKPII